MPQIKGSGSHLRPVKDKVRAAVKNRRLRLEEFFQPFDAMHTKKVFDANRSDQIRSDHIPISCSISLYISGQIVPDFCYLHDIGNVSGCVSGCDLCDTALVHISPDRISMVRFLAPRLRMAMFTGSRSRS